MDTPKASRLVVQASGGAGETNLQTKGFAGASGRDASRLLEEALGVRASEQLTGEFYAGQPAQRHVQEGGRA